MRLVRFLPERWQSLAQELVTFGTVGVLNAIADFAVFNLLLPIGPLKANLVSTFAATSLSYLLNRHWTYRHRARTTMHREYVLFFAFNLVGFLIQSAVLGLAKYGLGFTEHDDRMAFNIAKAAGVGVAMVFRFWSYRTFVFKQHPTVATVDIAPEPAPTPEPAAAAPAPAAPAAEPQPVASAAPRQVNGSRLDDDEFDQLTAPLEAELSSPDPVTSND